MLATINLDELKRQSAALSVTSANNSVGSLGFNMTASPCVLAALAFISKLAWPTVVGGAVVLSRKDIGSGLRGLLYRAEEIGPKGVKLGVRPEQQSNATPENSGPTAGLRTVDTTPLALPIANLVE